VVSAVVDGRSIEGHVVPIFSDGKEHTVEIVLGKAGHAGAMSKAREKMLIKQ
jgi:hypothetical protein